MTTRGRKKSEKRPASACFVAVGSFEAGGARDCVRYIDSRRAGTLTDAKGAALRAESVEKSGEEGS
eukprot:8614334-Pyramimonas_sp.AAC.1